MTEEALQASHTISENDQMSGRFNFHTPAKGRRASNALSTGKKTKKKRKKKLTPIKFTTENSAVDEKMNFDLKNTFQDTHKKQNTKTKSTFPTPISGKFYSFKELFDLFEGKPNEDLKRRLFATKCIPCTHQEFRKKINKTIKCPDLFREWEKLPDPLNNNNKYEIDEAINVIEKFKEEMSFPVSTTVTLMKELDYIPSEVSKKQIMKMFYRKK